MGREIKIETPAARQNAGEQVACISGNCCDPATWPAQWDMVCIRCIFCPDDAAVLARARTTAEITVYDQIVYDDPYFDGTQWTTKRFDGGGFAYTDEDGTHIIGLLRNVSCDAAADTIYHEIWHTTQSNMTPSEAEYDAYYNTEAWTVRKGLAGRPELRSTDQFGNTVADMDKVRAFVDQVYPGGDQGDGWRPTAFRPLPPETQEYNDATGEYRWRPSREGDSIYAEGQLLGAAALDAAEFHCN